MLGASRLNIQQIGLRRLIYIRVARELFCAAAVNRRVLILDPLKVLVLIGDRDRWNRRNVTQILIALLFIAFCMWVVRVNRRVMYDAPLILRLIEDMLRLVVVIRVQYELLSK